MIPKQDTNSAVGAETEGEGMLAGGTGDEMEAPESQGIMICYKKYVDGKKVVCLKPIDDDPEEQGGSSYPEISVTNDEQALKAVLKLSQESEVGEDQSQGFKAGLESQPANIAGRGKVY